MSKKLVETCDRCNETFDHLPGDVRIHLGGKTLATNMLYDLCAVCTDELRAFLHTQPND